MLGNQLGFHLGVLLLPSCQLLTQLDELLLLTLKLYDGALVGVNLSVQLFDAVG